MGERTSVFVFKGPNQDDFRSVFCGAVRQLRGHCNWDVHPPAMDSKLLTSHKGIVHAAYIHWEDYRVASAVGKMLAGPWINVRIQEGTLWDYSLYQGSDNVDNFSTMPEYWDENPEHLAKWRGNPSLLAKVCSIDQSSIEKYYQPWYGGLDEDEGLILHRKDLAGKAYPHDEFDYGDIWQMTDFLRALGAHDPNWDQPNCVARELVPAKEKKWWQWCEDCSDGDLTASTSSPALRVVRP